MKNYKYRLLGCAAIVAITAVILNLEVTTLQGVNYKVHAVKLPLYLKLLDFFDRHYNYGVLVKKIVSGAKSDEDKAVRIFEWTRKNISDNPRELPVIDDHVWHIIVRGYGVDDQFQDVFTTLCNYAGLNAFFYDVYSEAGNERKPLSFVKLGNEWTVFDAYKGVYFLNGKGRLAGISDLSGGNWKPVSIVNNGIPYRYGVYFKKLNSIDFKKWPISRGSLQSPFNRLAYEVMDRLKMVEHDQGLK